MKFEHSLSFANKMDEADPLASMRSRFEIPHPHGLSQCRYFAGNSLGLAPRRAREYVDQELEDWARLGVEGHRHARKPWLPYHEFLTASTARLVGARESEVVVMNTLTVNLHLMLVSFYRPTAARHRILIEAGAFPSDQYAVASQIRFHGFDPKTAIIRANSAKGILEAIEREGEKIALVLLGNVNYLTGEAFPVVEIRAAAAKHGCVFGLDLAHGAGNLLLELHDWDVDFAVWCSYKYLNAGPGAIAGCFVHERHHRDATRPRFAGWWGHDKASRFEMGPDFSAIPTAEGWQLSNPPILPLAALRASMEIFDEATMPAIRKKSDQLTAYLEFRLKAIPGVEILTPSEPSRRGAQLSLRIGSGGARKISDRLSQQGMVCDFREPDVLRVAPVALYNRFSDVYWLTEALAALVKAHAP